MPLDTSIYNQIQNPDYLGSLSRGMQLGESIQDRPNRLADLAAQRELRQQQVTQGRREIEAYPQQQAEAEAKSLEEKRKRYAGIIKETLTPLVMGDSSPQALMNAYNSAKQYGVPEDVLNQQFADFGNIQDPAQIKKIASGHAMSIDQWLKQYAPEKPAKPETTFGKINPADYTPASLKQFMQSNDYSALVPREKIAPPEAPQKPMTADQESKFLDRWNKDYKEVTSAVASAGEITKAAKKVKEGKGLSGATGYQAYVPSYPGSDASNVEADLETLRGKITSMGKAVMAASGSIGPMAIQEWKIVSDAIAAIDPTKLSPKKLKEQIELVELQADGMAKRVQDAYDRQYQGYYEKYPQMRLGNSQPSTGAPQAKDQEAIAWARANRNDPRAVQILKLHGM